MLRQKTMRQNSTNIFSSLIAKSGFTLRPGSHFQDVEQAPPTSVQ